MGGELAIRDLDFEASAALGAQAQFRLSGNCDSTIVTRLTALVDELHTQIVAGHVRNVVVDIRGVEFMNATCFNVFVTWINLINDLPPDDRYLLRFTINSAIPWQRRSLRTLSCFATDLVQVVD
jgi:hypothetical protein